MKKHTTRVAALFGLLLVFAATPAFAQDRLLAATVPFEFSISDSTLPAGRYVVTASGPIGTTLLVQGAGHGAVALQQQLVRPVKGAGTAMLVFHRYDGQYFLAQVISEDDTTRLLSMSRTEKLVIKNRAHKLAQNKTEAEIVTVIAGQR